jgi:hypothetical protein
VKEEVFTEQTEAHLLAAEEWNCKQSAKEVCLSCDMTFDYLARP